MQKPQLQKCCIPKCAATEQECGSGFIKYFRAPFQNRELCNTWKISLPSTIRAQFKPIGSWICSQHFEDHFILKDDVIITDDGRRVSIPRTNWTLTDGAVPGIFKGYESEITEVIPEPHYVGHEEQKETEEGSKDKSSDSVQEPKVKKKRKPGRLTRNRKKNSQKKTSKDGLKEKASESFDEVVEAPEMKEIRNIRRPRKYRAITPEECLVKISDQIFEAPEIDSEEGSDDRTVKEKEKPGRPPRIKKFRNKFVKADAAVNDKPKPQLSKHNPRANLKAQLTDVNISIAKPKENLSAAKSKSVVQSKKELIPENLNPSSSQTSLVKKISIDVIRKFRCFVNSCVEYDTNIFNCPSSDKRIIEQWIKTIAKFHPGRIFDIKTDLLCHKHFDDKFLIKISTGIVLAGDAVPTKFEKEKTPLKRSFVPDSNVSFSARSSKVGRISSTLFHQQVSNESQFDTTTPVSKVVNLKSYSRNQIDSISLQGQLVQTPPSNITKTTLGNWFITTPPVITPSRRTPIITPLPPPAQIILEMGHIGYNLNYIYGLRHEFQLSSANKWIFEIVTDKITKKLSIFIGEIIFRNNELYFQRVIKVFSDLTFKIETNGIDMTGMFNELGDKISTLRKLQDIINDLSAYQVCQGWSGYEDLGESSNMGKKIGGLWYSKSCECLKLQFNRCHPCTAISPSLIARRCRLRMNIDLSIEDQIRMLPMNDPLNLQLQIEVLKKQNYDLTKELQATSRRELKLEKKVKEFGKYPNTANAKGHPGILEIKKKKQNQKGKTDPEPPTVEENHAQNGILLTTKITVPEIDIECLTSFAQATGHILNQGSMKSTTSGPSHVHPNAYLLHLVSPELYR